MTIPAMEDKVTIHDAMDLDTRQVVGIPVLPSLLGTLCVSFIKIRQEKNDVRKKKGASSIWKNKKDEVGSVTDSLITSSYGTAPRVAIIRDPRVSLMSYRRNAILVNLMSYPCPI
jgi:hypothetical protein